MGPKLLVDAFRCDKSPKILLVGAIFLNIESYFGLKDALIRRGGMKAEAEERRKAGVKLEFIRVNPSVFKLGYYKRYYEKKEAAAAAAGKVKFD